MAEMRWRAARMQALQFALPEVARHVCDHALFSSPWVLRKVVAQPGDLLRQETRRRARGVSPGTW